MLTSRIQTLACCVVLAINGQANAGTNCSGIGDSACVGLGHEVCLDRHGGACPTGTEYFAGGDCTGTGDARCAAFGGDGVCLDREGRACPTGTEGVLCRCVECHCAEKEALIECFVVAINDVPSSSTILKGGDVVDIECYIEALQGFILGGLQLDFSCCLQTGFLCSIGNAVVIIDVPHGPFPGDNIFGITGLYPVGAGPCNLAAVGSAGTSRSLETGDRYYIATVIYTVSPDAAGDFPGVLESRSKPAQRTDVTRIRDAAGFLIGFLYSDLILTVPSGTCCDGVACLDGPVGQVHCEEVIGGTWNPLAQSCNDGEPCNSNCCLPDGRCERVTLSYCLGQGGTQLPEKVSCEGDIDNDGVDAECGDPCPSDPLNDPDNDGICGLVDLCPDADDNIDADGNGLPDCLESIPTVSAWGLAVLTLLLLTAWKIRFGRLHEVS